MDERERKDEEARQAARALALTRRARAPQTGRSSSCCQHGRRRECARAVCAAFLLVLRQSKKEVGQLAGSRPRREGGTRTVDDSGGGDGDLPRARASRERVERWSAALPHI